MLRGKYDSDFLEVYNKFVENEYTLLSDLTDRALANVNTHFGSAPIYTLSSWAEASVDNLKLYGIISEQAVYQYKSEITREQFCEIIYVIVKKLDANKLSTEITDKFVDADNKKILALSELGLINGTSINEFSPSELITREASTVVIARLINLFDFENSDISRHEFSDRSLISIWAVDSVRIVASQGIINGSGNNMFNPKKNLTYEQTLII